MNALTNTPITGLIKELMNDNLLDHFSANLFANPADNHHNPIIQLTHQFIHHAIQLKASDIHFEPAEKNCRVRLRQQGLLTEITVLPTPLAERLISCIKILSKLDIAERRLPQDGRFYYHSTDIRVNTCPTLFGEKIVLRLLNGNALSLDMTSLGLTEEQQKLFNQKLNRPQGLILVTGPTGAGKTLTLYTALNSLNSIEKNISTVEDPVEITLPGINQIAINPKINLHFSTILRSLLRQDPDVLMVGEIRDKETADLAIQAAQTGHLVLSTLHTNNAVETLTRLKAMGIPSYHLAHSLSLIVAQRLIRILCVHCKKTESIPSHTLFSPPAHYPEKITLYRATGCSACLNGYQHRLGIYELLPITPSLSQLILDNTSSTHLLNAAKEEGFMTLQEMGMQKIMDGTTSLFELNRVMQL